MGSTRLRSAVASLSTSLTNDPHMTNPMNEHGRKIREAFDAIASIAESLERENDSRKREIESLKRELDDLKRRMK